MTFVSGISFVSHTRAVDAAEASSRDVVYQRGKTACPLRTFFSPRCFLQCFVGFRLTQKKSHLTHVLGAWFSHSFTIYKADKILRNYEEFG